MDIGWKVVSTVSSLVAGLVAKQIVEKSWQVVTGHASPDEDDFESNLVELVAFSVVAGATNTLIHNMVMRKANQVYGKGSKSVAHK